MNDSANKYDPNGIGAYNGNFLGLPKVKNPKITFLGVPFGVTVSYGAGTEGGPANVLEASYQLDVCIPHIKKPWTNNVSWKMINCGNNDDIKKSRDAAKRVIEKLEHSEKPSIQDIETVNTASKTMLVNLEAEVANVLQNKSFPVIIGGEHAISLAAFKAIGKHNPKDFGILQIDAHMDLRDAYEGFKYSHASVMYNALKIPNLIQLTQVGIRDWCPAEQQIAEEENRISVFYDNDIQTQKMEGHSFQSIVKSIINTLPDRVWISLDIDGLEPQYCQNTGTPVAGGLTFNEAIYLCKAIRLAGKQVLGLGILEVAGQPHEYEGSVAARLAYTIANHSIQ